ncbi:MAG: CDP-diacylglycerol--glycerol-3-phosphate 3-phosphatidyltransferase [Candidatus Marinimicrobia bacterium]|nr:CDP-diacylglycerol--glycerol-3-phosphate 3-phosphatidyltransferase [Candidatus Neomarinimicrobiota bacterium]
MLNLPNILTILRILLTPIFIFLLFMEFQYANLFALLVFIIASITDAYDGYFARKHQMVTPQGMFLDPLADKILVSSAFISFAILGIVEYWMVTLIIFRDLFVTGLRMAMVKKGLNMETIKLAKAKTGIQITIIIFILLFLVLRGLPILGINWIIQYISWDIVIYYLMLGVTLFTTLTGINYLYLNRLNIKRFLN